MSEILIFDWVLSSTYKERSQNKEGLGRKYLVEYEIYETHLLWFKFFGFLTDVSNLNWWCGSIVWF